MVNISLTLDRWLKASARGVNCQWRKNEENRSEEDWWQTPLGNGALFISSSLVESCSTCLHARPQPKGSADVGREKYVKSTRDDYCSDDMYVCTELEAKPYLALWLIPEMRCEWSLEVTIIEALSRWTSRSSMSLHQILSPYLHWCIGYFSSLDPLMQSSLQEMYHSFASPLN